MDAKLIQALAIAGAQPSVIGALAADTSGLCVATQGAALSTQATHAVALADSCMSLHAAASGSDHCSTVVVTVEGEDL
jgi:hypothetical protein